MQLTLGAVASPCRNIDAVGKCNPAALRLTGMGKKNVVFPLREADKLQ